MQVDPERARTFLRGAHDAIESIDWQRIIQEHGDIIPNDSIYDQDAERGGVATLPSDEGVQVVLAFMPAAIEQVLEAWDHWIDHDCEGARPILDSVLELLFTILIENGGR